MSLCVAWCPAQAARGLTQAQKPRVSEPPFPGVAGGMEGRRGIDGLMTPRTMLTAATPGQDHGRGGTEGPCGPHHPSGAAWSGRRGAAPARQGSQPRALAASRVG